MFAYFRPSANVSKLSWHDCTKSHIELFLLTKDEELTDDDAPHKSEACRVEVHGSDIKGVYETLLIFL